MNRFSDSMKMTGNTQACLEACKQTVKIEESGMPQRNLTYWLIMMMAMSCTKRSHVQLVKAEMRPYPVLLKRHIGPIQVLSEIKSSNGLKLYLRNQACSSKYLFCRQDWFRRMHKPAFQFWQLKSALQSLLGISPDNQAFNEQSHWNIKFGSLMLWNICWQELWKCWCPTLPQREWWTTYFPICKIFKGIFNSLHTRLCRRINSKWEIRRWIEWRPWNTKPMKAKSPEYPHLDWSGPDHQRRFVHVYCHDSTKKTIRKELCLRVQKTKDCGDSSCIYNGIRAFPLPEYMLLGTVKWP